MRKTILTALSTAILLGGLAAGSVALAGADNSAEGGYKVGPLGQALGSDWRGNETAGRNAYGFVPSIQKQPVHKHTKAAR